MLPTDVEKIILNYKDGIEHYDKFKNCLNELKNIETVIVGRNTFFYTSQNSYKKTVQVNTCKICGYNKITRVVLFKYKNDNEDDLEIISGVHKMRDCCKKGDTSIYTTASGSKLEARKLLNPFKK